MSSIDRDTDSIESAPSPRRRSRRVPRWSPCAVALAARWPRRPLAATYKWTDANGRVIYSDQPPSGNVKVEADRRAAAARQSRTR